MHCCLMFVSQIFAGKIFLVVVLDRFFLILETKKWSLVPLDSWSSYAVTIVWEFAWVGSALVVLVVL